LIISKKINNVSIIARAYVALEKLECSAHDNIKGLTNYHFAFFYTKQFSGETDYIEKEVKDKKIFIERALAGPDILKTLTINSVVAISLFFPDLANKYWGWDVYTKTGEVKSLCPLSEKSNSPPQVDGA
jgi:hypothetical protein